MYICDSVMLEWLLTEQTLNCMAIFVIFPIYQMLMLISNNIYRSAIAWVSIVGKNFSLASTLGISFIQSRCIKMTNLLINFNCRLRPSIHKKDVLSQCFESTFKNDYGIMLRNHEIPRPWYLQFQIKLRFSSNAPIMVDPGMQAI